jgi:citrate synthase
MALGLDGVAAVDTVLSHSDAGRARLWLRGRPLEDVVHSLGYENAIALLWSGFAGADLTGEQIRSDLGAGRQRAFVRLGRWLPGIADRTITEATRLCLAATPDDSTPAQIAGALAVGVTAILRNRKDLPPVAPDPALTTAADFLRMMTGTAGAPAAVKALETYFTVALENGLGPSTFSARVVASTGATLAASILAAYCAFEGPLHGGAPVVVLTMLEDVQASGDIDAWLERKLAAGKRIAGFGNRAFPNGDPRADLLAEAVGVFGIDQTRARFAAEFERRALAALARRRPGKPLRPNLEIYAAVLLDACGVPGDAFTSTFATARVAGWLAHAMEQQQTGRMLRPTSHYNGPTLS